MRLFAAVVSPLVPLGSTAEGITLPVGVGVGESLQIETTFDEGVPNHVADWVLEVRPR